MNIDKYDFFNYLINEGYSYDIFIMENESYHMTKKIDNTLYHIHIMDTDILFYTHPSNNPFLKEDTIKFEKSLLRSFKLNRLKI